MKIVLDLSKEQLEYLTEQIEKITDSAYKDEDLYKGVFFENLTQQLEREKWK
jgi:hypothetical protein